MSPRRKKAGPWRRRVKHARVTVRGYCRRKPTRRKYGKSHRGEDMPF